MSAPKTIGFPRMMKEEGEKRVFPPEMIGQLAGHGVTIFIEEGYGARSGLGIDDYRRGNERVRFCSRGETFKQDLVMVLRCPAEEDFEKLRKGACLISMLHFPTRPGRVERLKSLGADAISLDSIANDNGLRLVENMRAVAWNGLEAACDVLEERWPGVTRPDGEPLRVLVLGSGMVGKHAVDAATKFGNLERNERHMASGGPGVIVLIAGRNLSANVGRMEKLFRTTDILVDATQRRDASRPAVPNEWLGWLPEHAVVTDLSVDPYTLDTTPPVVRAVEGIPQGNLDKYTFKPDDGDWDRTVPASIRSDHRRAVVSCYSWPGIHPKECMHHYAEQLEPLMEILLRKGYAGLSAHGGFFERALHRATLRHWLASA